MFFMNKIMIKLWTQTFHSYEGKSSKIFLKIEWTWFSPFTLNSIDLLFRCGGCSCRLYSWSTNTGTFRRHRQSIAIIVCSLQSDLLYMYIVYCYTKKSTFYVETSIYSGCWYMVFFKYRVRMCFFLITRTKLLYNFTMQHSFLRSFRQAKM